MDEAARQLRALGRFGLEYAEQPCATLAELAELRRRTDVPLAADESIRRAEDPRRSAPRARRTSSCSRPRRWAGWRAALEIAADCGLPVVVSSAVESSVGLAAGVALAAALPELPYACGLGTMSLLAGDVTADPLAPVDGALPVRAAAPDPARLAAFETDPAPWRARISAAARFLGAQFPEAQVPEAQFPGPRSLEHGEPGHRVRRAVADELVRSGLTEAVLAPGSRSAPLALALLRRSQAGDLRLHVRIDERSAGFLALGLAKASRRPVRGAVHLGDGRGAPPRGGHRGRRGRCAAAGAHRGPAARAPRHRGQPGHRPAEAVRVRGPLVLPRPGCPRTGPARRATGGRWPAGPGPWRRAPRAGSPGRCT